MDLGELYLRGMRKPQEALEAYRAALALEPGHVGVHYAMGLALAETGDAAGAEGQFTEASRLAPTNPLPWQALGELASAGRSMRKPWRCLHRP
jgi:cytochrome c-type biogenesis protein CcmH/NrfG